MKINAQFVLHPLSPFSEELVDGDVGPQLPGKAGEGMLLLGQRQVQLQGVGLCLQGDVQTSLEDERGQRTYQCATGSCFYLHYYHRP